jgi:hypothetical protein
MGSASRGGPPPPPPPPGPPGRARPPPTHPGPGSHLVRSVAPAQHEGPAYPEQVLPGGQNSQATQAGLAQQKATQSSCVRTPGSLERP